MTQTFGQVVRSLRDNRGLSLREFAEKLEVSPAFISDIELGRRYPSEDVLSKMASVLKVKEEELKKYDQREAIEGLKEQILANPSLVPLFRKVVQRHDFAEEIRKLAEKKKDDE